MINYNPFFTGATPIKSPEQIQNEYSQLMNQYQNIFNRQQPMQSQNQAMSYNGTYQYVNSYEEVANAPVPTDGTAKLFIHWDSKTMWAKKFVDGKHNIQTYIFDVYNGNTNAPSGENPVDSIKELSDRLSRLENEMLKPRATKTAKPKVVEVEKDEL